LIVRPGSGLMQPAALLTLAAAFCAAVLQVTTRLASRRDPPLTVLAYTTLVGAVAANLALPLFWVTPRPASWLALAAVGFFGLAATVAMIRAYAAAPASAVSPYNYTGMVSATLLGYLVFDHLPDPMTVAGMAVIAGSGVYVFHRERLAREAAARA
jgi:drug/metabolite transporter (DMT)-like permease